MPSNYPANLDSWPTIGPLLSSTPHSDVHVDLQDAIEAVQTELGTDPAGPSSTVGARFGLYTLIPRTFANRAAVLAATARFVGETVYETEARRIWTWFGGVDEWRITGASIPRTLLVRSTAHGLQFTATQALWQSVNLSGHTGPGDEFLSGYQVVVPTGLGGDYDLAAGAMWTVNGAASADQTRGLRISITNNTSIVELSSLESIATATIPTGGRSSQSLSKTVRLRAGATLTMQINDAAPHTLSASWLTLSMVAHIPSLT